MPVSLGGAGGGEDEDLDKAPGSGSCNHGNGHFHSLFPGVLLLGCGLRARATDSG